MMVFPYETEAANGEPMPDGLSLVDQCAFYFLQTMYRGLRTGSKDRDQATAANERFPQFRSQHEGYAVILEEFDEAKEQLEAAELFLDHMWDSVRHDSPAKLSAESMMMFSINAACEAIQVAAMCRKFMGMEGKR